MSRARPGTVAKGRYPIVVLARALDLLDALESNGTLSLTEASAITGINKVTTLRVLANLAERGYVERDPTSLRYRLGLRLLKLSARLAEGIDLRTLARPLLYVLQAASKETVNLAVPGNAGITYIDILESGSGLRMAAKVGSQDSYHSTAVGKAMLAYMAPERSERLMARSRLSRKTAKTITDPAVLRSELRRIRARGYAIDDEENEVGARCVAAPIFDHTSELVGAVSVSGPTSRLPAARLREFGPRVRALTQEISTRMGYRALETSDRRVSVRRQAV